MKIGDLIQCRKGTEKEFWHKAGVGVVTKIVPHTWEKWEGPVPLFVVKVLWWDGIESTISTKWVEKINEKNT